MMKEDRKIWSLLAIIVSVLLFALSPLPNLINEIQQDETPWLHRTEQDVVKELQFELESLRWNMGSLNEENRKLRFLAFGDKFKLHALIDYLMQSNMELRRENLDLRGRLK